MNHNRIQEPPMAKAIAIGASETEILATSLTSEVESAVDGIGLETFSEESTFDGFETEESDLNSEEAEQSSEDE